MIEDEVLEEVSEEVGRALELLMTVQRAVSSIAPGAVPEVGKTVSKEQMRSHALALVVEVAEFIQTIDWKPWTPGEFAKFKGSVERTTDEFADILAFLGLIVLYLENMGVSPYDLSDAYVAKTKVNIRRLKERFA
jgi:NTP pyrophosphatase (non-canonical NTP hydrolase)